MNRFCASSRGLGRACAQALAAEGVAVVINGRDADRLVAAAEELRAATGATVTAVAGDISTEAGRAALLAACPDPDILVNNNGGPPPGRFEDWDHAAWLGALEANLLAPVLGIDGSIQDSFGRLAIGDLGSISAEPTEPSYGSNHAAGLDRIKVLRSIEVGYGDAVRGVTEFRGLGRIADLDQELDAPLIGLGGIAGHQAIAERVGQHLEHLMAGCQLPVCRGLDQRERLVVLVQVNSKRAVGQPWVRLHNQDAPIANRDMMQVGERVQILPNHVCVVSNLHDEIAVARGGVLLDTRRVEARGKTR